MQNDRRSANRLVTKAIIQNTANDALRQRGKVATNSGGSELTIQAYSNADIWENNSSVKREDEQIDA